MWVGSVGSEGDYKLDGTLLRGYGVWSLLVLLVVLLGDKLITPICHAPKGGGL